jgi:PAS domain S-box-containing protein
VAAALAFDDRAAANEYLHALEANKQVEAAAIYDERGTLAASYSRSPGSAFPPSAVRSPARRGRPFVIAPVVQGSTLLGAVHLRRAHEPFASQAGRYGWVALIALMGSVVASALAFAHATVRRANRELERRAGALHEIATRQSAILDSAMDSIVTVDPSGRIASVNRAGERMFKRSSEELLGTRLEQLLDLGSGQATPIIEQLETTPDALAGGVLKELTAHGGDGATFPVDVALRSMELPDGLHLVAMLRDISDRKRTEQLKDEFVSTVSHELRTPLTSIAGSLALLVGGAAGELPARAARLVGIAHSNCQRLVRLINDILDIEKIESGKLRFDLAPVRVTDLAERSIEGVGGYAGELGVEVVLDAPDESLVIGADADRAEQVATNLLSNAIKFSPAGGRVTVSISREGSVARLSVRDQGPGIPEEFRHRIFSKFAQADSSDTRQKGGTGLGLAIAREIVERHGGRLWFETEVGRGTTFHADFPLARPAEAPESTPRVDRLLVCEDDADAAAVLQEILRGDGFAVDVVGTVGDAKAKLAGRDGYRALLLDLRLPDGDGLGLIRDLRKGEGTWDLPIIVVSAFVDEAKEDSRGHALSVVDWMEKPVDIDRLRRAVSAALARSTERRPLILHVDDDEDILQVTAAAIANLGEVLSVSSLDAARAALARRMPQLVILDLGLGDHSGLELLGDLDRFERPVPVLVFSAQDTDARLLNQVDAVLTKSRTSLAHLARTARRLVRDSEMREASGAN